MQSDTPWRMCKLEYREYRTYKGYDIHSMNEVCMGLACERDTAFMMFLMVLDELNIPHSVCKTVSELKAHLK